VLTETHAINVNARYAKTTKTLQSLISLFTVCSPPQMMTCAVVALFQRIVIQCENMQPNKKNPENDILLLSEIVQRCTIYLAQVEGAFQS
jgi:hypothetical protein